MRIEQYFLMTDYSLWEVILNGDSPALTRVVEGVLQPVAPTTAEQMLARKNELKARGTLLMALLDKHQLKFNSHKDTKSLMKAIEKRFGRNTKTKKVQKTLLKQQYENFSGSSTESLDQIHDKLQEQSLDDLFNSLKMYEAEVKSSSSACTTTQNIAFVSSSNTDSTTEPVSVAASVYAVCAKMSVSSLPSIDADDLEEMDLKWQMAMLTVRARRFLQMTGRNLGANGPTSMGFDMSKVECYNCHKKGHFSRKCRSPKDSKRNGAVEPQRRNVPVETSTSNALVSQCDGVGSYDWSFQAEEEPVNYALMAFSSSSSSSDDEVVSCWKACTKAYAQLQSHYDKLTTDFQKSQFDVILYQTGLKSVEARLLVYKQIKSVFKEDIKLLKLEVQLRDNALVSLRQTLEKAEQERDDLKLNDGYHDVPPPYTKTFMPPKPDLVYNNAPTAVETDHPALTVSDSEDESETKTPQIVPSFVQSTEQVKSPRPSVQHVETSIPAATPKPASPKPTSNGKKRNRKACFVCKSLDHLIKDCDYHEKKMAQPTTRNHAHMGTPKHYAPMTRQNPQQHMVPAAVLPQSKPVPITAVRPVRTAVPKIKVTRPRHAKPIVTKPKSPIKRHINRSKSLKVSISPPRVTAVKDPVVNDA
uniref:Putative ribonuclease H-like domain-containing protein n=1 Tax=Tanacetum cinerariifolium TaxID=118510 RepID=A0A6L2M288_TANCI|nr:putative ribonuclease H-like domain-containing protein [Tanacetum cinerariifolium]